MRIATLGVALIGPLSLLAAMGGPDQYGYIWKDSDEPGGPVYSWIDITATGIPVTGLADDNTFGPYIMEGNMPYYWYDVKKVWVGSNGYVAFNGGNIAATFPVLPAAGATENYIAAFMTDLTFAGAGNPAQCFLQDEPTRLIISWINVPFWNVAAPGYTGSNTFQLILNKQDSTITVQYQAISGTTSSNGPVIGIESLTGSIGLARSQSLMPAGGYAVRFYNPAVPLLQVTDAAVQWVDVDGTGGTMAAVGANLPLTAQVQNTGNQPLPAFTVTSKVIGPGAQLVLTETVDIPPITPNGTMGVPLLQSFTPVAPGTYTHRVEVSGVAGDLIATNNTMDREMVIYPSNADQVNASWAGPTDNGVGIGWNGGNGGVAAYIIPPFVPCQITGTTVRITSNAGSSFAMMVYDDDGPDGGPGTLLDSTVVPAANGGPGDHVYPLASPVQVAGSGGYYVAWYMLGANVNIAVDAVPPFSLRCYEVLGGAWAEYRDRATSDFHLGLQVQQPPFVDVGVLGLVGINNGQQVANGTTVQALVKNFGNAAITGFPVNYRFGTGSVVSQNYTGTPVSPGNSALVTFTQPLVSASGGSDALCTWTSAAADIHPDNDSSCVNINMPVGIRHWDPAPLKLFPDPAQDFIFIEGLPPGAFIAEMVDANGARQPVRTSGGNSGRCRLDVRNLAPGTYFLRIHALNTVLHARFVKQQ